MTTDSNTLNGEMIMATALSIQSTILTPSRQREIQVRRMHTQHSLRTQIVSGLQTTIKVIKGWYL
jgi:hypothetical protein